MIGAPAVSLALSDFAVQGKSHDFGYSVPNVVVSVRVALVYYTRVVVRGG